jgi:hypothetical protein
MRAGKKTARIPIQYTVKNPTRKRTPTKDYSNFMPSTLKKPTQKIEEDSEDSEDYYVPGSLFEACLDNVVANIYRLCQHPNMVDEDKDKLEDTIHIIIEICDKHI